MKAKPTEDMTDEDYLKMLMAEDTPEGRALKALYKLAKSK